MQGVQVNQAKEARMFGHDAVALGAAGAIPTIGVVTSLSKLQGGTGYADGPVTVATTSGTDGADLTVSITASGGVIQTATIVAGGTNYEEGEVITVSGGGGSNGKFVVSTKISGTSERGCCLYVGQAGNINVRMESGNVVTFYGVNAGTFLPVLVTHVSLPAAEAGYIATTCKDVLAIF